MKYLLAAATDAGLRKETNQDSVLIKRALLNGDEQIVLAVICDGMGGLEKGELASASLIKAFSKWFDQELPSILAGTTKEAQLLSSWDRLIKEMNYKIGKYGTDQRIRLGSTLTAMLFVSEEYYIAHVGDSRAYELYEYTIQLTKDQTLVQREVDEGILTFEEAKTDMRRNILLQCIGSSEEVLPVYLKGKIEKNAVYLLCCDGFCHVVNAAEIYQSLGPEKMLEEQAMEEKIRQFIQIIKERGEQDNISAIAIRTW